MVEGMADQAHACFQSDGIILLPKQTVHVVRKLDLVQKAAYFKFGTKKKGVSVFIVRIYIVH